MSIERVQKILAQAGIASRRKAEQLISDGQVTINGKVAKLGDKATLGKDAIKVSGKLLVASGSPVYLAFHKPKGVLTALSDPDGRTTITDFLKKVKQRVFPVGRLEFNAEGLILLTNDGSFSERLQKSSGILRTYEVKTKGHPEPEILDKLARGVRVQGKHIVPQKLRLTKELASKSLIEVVLPIDSSADLKKLFELKGLFVDRLVRTAIGHLTIKGIQPGAYKYLKKSQVDALFSVSQSEDKTEVSR
jgi:pseudouridine synthase